MSSEAVVATAWEMTEVIMASISLPTSSQDDDDGNDIDVEAKAVDGCAIVAKRGQTSTQHQPSPQ